MRHPRLNLILLLAAFAAVLTAGVASGAAESTKARAAKAKRGWMNIVLITEYWPAPEKWFKGKRVGAAGISGRHRVDWLYSARGMSMEGDGVALDGKRFHIESIGRQGWVNADGKRTSPAPGRWTGGPPFWRAMGWRNSSGRVTFPLHTGGWSRGKGRKYIRPQGISFGSGSSLPLKYWRSLATDPRLIPRGSRVYIPFYKNKPGGGWFRAQDTGGAVQGRHIDVFRAPPKTPSLGRSLHNRRVFVIPPGG
jgi:3D (Asp-Asp-Asp) domain-containing protein